MTPIWLAVVIAFVVEDFAGYWMHRLNHRVNIFWNRHIIHHRVKTLIYHVRYDNQFQTQ
ncbi:MAG: hypothetical protein CM1200mP1_04360 [Candidatus Neomarinimicrobiota bacterium]|nr:MAG: hypothetical protein CM1200mP1_04360 [Candidatus Neomarinimicrobiota bacterium]